MTKAKLRRGYNHAPADRNGENNPNAKLKLEDIVHIRAQHRLLIDGLASRYRIERRHVIRIIRGHRWGNVPEAAS